MQPIICIWSATTRPLLPFQLVRHSPASKPSILSCQPLFIEVFTTNLYKWMRVYDYHDGQEHAETWMEDLSEDELEASVYRKVDLEIPACIKRRSKTLKYRRARSLAAGNPAPHERGSRADPPPA